ncbi:MAG TPA: ABC transporter permease [Xanthobacteraceae bacterium]|nr:ABC transporter permease [Xanthobacteraceae bacterium]
MALTDLWAGLRRYEVWWIFAIHEIKQRFRRSVLGPFWLTLSMGVMVAALGLVFGTLFNQDMRSFLPYLSTGLIFWGLMTTVINEACTAFIVSEGSIRNVPMPLSVHLYRMMARNLIIWTMNMVIYLAVIVYFGVRPNANFFLFIPGFLLLLVNLFWMAMVASILSTRFRDIPQVIASLLQVVFFVTPIFWSIESLPTRPAFIHWNPFYHLLEIVRAPLLGAAPHALSWMIAVCLAIVGIPVALWLYRRAYPRIPYWV